MGLGVLTQFHSSCGTSEEETVKATAIISPVPKRFVVNILFNLPRYWIKPPTFTVIGIIHRT